MNKLNYGRAYFRFGDKSEEVDINAGPVARTRSMFYKSFVASGRTLEACYDGATPRIGRFSKLRPLSSTGTAPALDRITGPVR